MNITQIETNVSDLIKQFSPDSFIYDFLASYGLPKSSISRLKKGGLNLSKNQGEVIWKKKLFYKVEQNWDLHELFTELKTNKSSFKHDPRFIILTDFKILLALDTKTNDSIDISISELPKNFDFFLPLAGMEKAQHQDENPADVKAAEKMARLYEQISKDNPTQTQEEVHNLNVFLTRILFCFFAEDTGIFEKGLFTKSISSHTQVDGSDLNTYLDKLFIVLKSDENQRHNLPNYLTTFPYVNGGLFEKPYPSPIFNRKSRQSLIDSGELDWSAIHPDIFGSMIQAVITPEHRGGLGMHYTSVPNIMKVIEPLFLNDLYEELESSKYEPRKLNNLLDRISKIKIFDPACGSGNFLIIAYKELRMLEIKILQQLKTLQKVATGFEPKQLELIPKAQLTLAASYQHSMFSRIELSQFYGIELDDFAHEVAILSLWLAKHQMNLKFKEIFGSANAILPLTGGGNIVHGNATRINWESVCPKEKDDEIYILGNPPYKGSRYQEKAQKDDMKFVLSKYESYKKMDYVTCWIFISANYSDGVNCKFAFVTTNSITQGEQAPITFTPILNQGFEIFFAYQSFAWKNNARQKANVTVVIVGFSKQSKSQKYLFTKSNQLNVDYINPYLIPVKVNTVQKRKKPLSFSNVMTKGCYPTDGEGLILNENEYNVYKNNQVLNKYIRPFIGTTEFLHDKKRWCLYLDDVSYLNIKENDLLKERISIVEQSRLKSKKENTRKLAAIPYKFEFDSTQDKDGFILPCITSQNRKYIPVGIVKAGDIVYGTAQVIYSKQLLMFGILSSRMHVLWISITCGRMKTDYNYSSTLCYNTFPFPSITEDLKNEIIKFSMEVISAREKHSEKTIAQIYAPNKMPTDLLNAHSNLDIAIEKSYKSTPFLTDEERLECLFKLYEQMIGKENSKGTLFTIEPKLKSKKKK